MDVFNVQRSFSRREVCSAWRGKGEGLDISIVVVVFFHTLIFCFGSRSLENVSPTDLEICSFARHCERFRSRGLSYQPPPLPSLPLPTPRDSYFAVKRTAGERAFVARIAFERFALTACGVILRTLHAAADSTAFAYIMQTLRYIRRTCTPLGGQVPYLNYFTLPSR